MVKTLKLMLSDVWKRRLAIFLCVITLTPLQLTFGTVCPFKILTGVPCVACGLTRSTLLLVSGRPVESFHMHPLLIFVILGLLYALIVRYAPYLPMNRRKQKKNIWMDKALSYKWWKRYVVFCLLLFHICYLVRMRQNFPGSPPMDYYAFNLLSRILDHTR